MILDNHKSKSGFTLIELIVVIAILSILAAILIPLVSNFIERANQSADLANARNLFIAAALWYSIQESPNDTVNPDLNFFTGQDEYPDIRSKLYQGYFIVTVEENGSVSVESSSGFQFFP